MQGRLNSNQKLCLVPNIITAIRKNDTVRAYKGRFTETINICIMTLYEEWLFSYY